MAQKPLVDELLEALKAARQFCSAIARDAPHPFNRTPLHIIEPAIARAEAELQPASITVAERLEFAQAEWERWAGGPGEIGFRHTKLGAPGEIVCTKTGEHGWWEIALYSELDEVLDSALLETAAECIRWAHDPDSVDPADGPGIIGWERQTVPTTSIGD